jgi:hypothetical protein
MICVLGWCDSYRLLVSSQRSHIHLLRLHHLALAGVEVAEIVDRVQCRRVLGSPRLSLLQMMNRGLSPIRTSRIVLDSRRLTLEK